MDIMVHRRRWKLVCIPEYVFIRVLRIMNQSGLEDHLSTSRKKKNNFVTLLMQRKMVLTSVLIGAFLLMGVRCIQPTILAQVVFETASFQIM